MAGIGRLMLNVASDSWVQCAKFVGEISPRLGRGEGRNTGKRRADLTRQAILTGQEASRAEWAELRLLSLRKLSVVHPDRP